MADYKIAGVAKDPREYQSKFGDMKAYKLKLDGVEEPVEWSRKADSPAPKAGETISGTIEETQYGKKFKKDYTAGGGGGRQPKDEVAIKAMWAIGQACGITPKPTDDKASLDDYVALIESYAQQLFSMVERVKATPADVEPMPTDASEPASEAKESDEPVDDPFEGMDFGEDEDGANVE